MLGTNTNNFVESWHRNLKVNYLGSQREQRPGVVVFKILKKVMLDLRMRVLIIELDFTSRITTILEKISLQSVWPFH